ncbi:MAG TPA: hypothetical protein VFA10_22600, partial [Ktedonobacteraceae bacterium]|nr:hypothetical protein [Ktedonobacteraceae bacterium]
MSQQSVPIQVFCSYAPQDESLYQELEKHLSVLQHQNLIAAWHSRAGDGPQPSGASDQWPGRHRQDAAGRRIRLSPPG